MTGRIINRFADLLAAKAARDKRAAIPIEEISRATGVTWTTVAKWASGNVKRYDENSLAALCGFLECEVGDLLVYDPGRNGRGK